MTLSDEPAGSLYDISWVEIDVEGSSQLGCCQPWTGGPVWKKKTGWASQDEQANKQHASMVSAAVPVSNPALSSQLGFS